jgi:symplekin
VLSTIASLAYSDRAMLDTFVRQLGPAVLADVVMAQTMENLHLVGGRTMIDVQAGMGRGVEGIIERAAALHAAGVREGAAPGAGGTGRVRSIHWFPYDRVGDVDADP